jgi:hypothetical protein
MFKINLDVHCIMQFLLLSTPCKKNHELSDVYTRPFAVTQAGGIAVKQPKCLDWVVKAQACPLPAEQKYSTGCVIYRGHRSASR